ncbi:MAG: proline dehydrogenase family protein [Lentisphaeria bacterium]|nr:proline dehydrogenase family protein [Candidatus Neomarinimicrobiota bacterium]MCF7841501.1 proline dehydrogenase family protein [Lentisphaeria bacterium]
MLNRLIVSTMPLMPRWFIKLFSRRYIAGEAVEDAMNLCTRLKAEEFETTLDILGESISTVEEANASREAYIELIRRVSQQSFSKNISLKPTALGLNLDFELAKENITAVIRFAHENDFFVRIDMEDSPYTSQTLDIYRSLRAEFPRIGTVIQAYLHRSEADVTSIAAEGGNLRICKGIYRESPTIAFQDKEAIRENYLQLVKTMLSARAYVGIATHDIYLIDTLEAYIRDKGIPAENYEFQALLGVPIEHRLEALRDAGHTMRIYVPFGEQWYAYSSRRLKENPDVAGYVLKNLFKFGK